MDVSLGSPWLKSNRFCLDISKVIFLYKTDCIIYSSKLRSFWGCLQHNANIFKLLLCKRNKFHEFWRIRRESRFSENFKQKRPLCTEKSWLMKRAWAKQRGSKQNHTIFSKCQILCYLHLAHECMNWPEEDFLLQRFVSSFHTWKMTASQSS